MTEQEMERTAELLTSLAGKQSVVVEHDMGFVRSIPDHRTAPGQRAGRRLHGPGPNDPDVIKVYLGESLMLKIEKLNQFYGESHTLWDLELDVPQGQCTCVMGRNGVGKTTLMKCIMGEETVKSGAIEFAGMWNFRKSRTAPAGHRLRAPGPANSRRYRGGNLRTGLAVRADGISKSPSASTNSSRC